MPDPVGWKPKTQYLVACPDRGRDDVSVQALPSLREAQDRVSYWRQLTSNSQWRIVKAVTTYALVEESAAADAAPAKGSE